MTDHAEPGVSLALNDEVVRQIQAAAQLDAAWSPERIKTVWKMAAPAAKTVQVLAAFLAVAKRYDLDPLIGEIYLIETQQGPKVCTGRETYIKKASADPEYQGIISGVVREGDTFQIVRAGGALSATVTIEHAMGLKRGGLLLGYCAAYRKGKAPVVVVREWARYAHLQNKVNWKVYGEDMLETRCIVAALRRQYPLAGLYIESEFAEDEPAAIAAAEGLSAAEATARTAAELRERLAAAKTAAPAAVEEAELVPEAPAPAQYGDPIEDEAAVREDERRMLAAEEGA
jgi:hypothetical protein